MRAYRAILSAQCRILLQYRAAAIAGLTTQLFWGLIRVMIFGGFYRSSTAPQPMTYAEVVSYVWLGQSLLRLMPWGVDKDVQAMIRSGSVAFEMLRPVDLYGMWYARALAALIAPTALRAAPLFPIAVLFFGLQLPPSLGSAFAGVASLIVAILMSAAITVLLTVSLLWTVAGEGIARLVPVTFFFLSGMVVPLPLFPDWAQPILRVLPFRGLIDAPFRLYMGHIPPAHLFATVGHQLAWAALFVIVGRLLLRRGLRRLVVQGG